VPAITLERLRCRFGDVVAVDGVDLAVPAGSLAFLLGPSGCGKTTVLRMIAGLQEPDSGHVRFGDRDVTHLPAERRNAGMVFQGYALWPHMSVRDNVAFGLDVRGVAATERATRTRQALEMVRMEALADRKPAQLSGGQQQRVALARALAFRPEVLLLDEPLSNLDARLRLEMREEIRRICREVGITAVYVTHDREEALSLADLVVVMHDGRIEQRGTPEDVYRRPASRFVASFMGETNLVQGEVSTADSRGSMIATAACTLASATGGLHPGARVTLAIRPESFRLSASGSISGRCIASSYLGERSRHLVDTPLGTLIVFEADPRASSRVGETLRLDVDRDAVVALPD
jgi:iron(III) transport system ATP-binding protein